MQLFTTLIVPLFLALLQTLAAYPTDALSEPPSADSLVAGNWTCPDCYQSTDSLSPLPSFPSENSTSPSPDFQALELPDRTFNFTRSWGLDCETSTGSPTAKDIYNAAGGLAWTFVEGKICKQINPAGSRCSQLQSSGEGKISLCGPQDKQLPCALVGYVAQQIAVQCKDKEGRTEGKQVHKGSQVRVAIHK